MADIHGLVDRLEKAVAKLEILAAGSSGDASSADTAVYVQAYDNLINGPVAEFMKKSKEIGGDVEKQADMFMSGIQLQRDILVMASQYQQPAEKDLSAIFAPLSGKIQAVQDFREKNRGSKLFNHLSSLSESVPALGWVAVAPKPGPFVKEMADAAMFYTNRVLKEYKDVDKKHVDWVRAYLNIWTDMQTYIKEHHTTGLTWKKTGPKASSAAPAPAAPPAPRAGPPPPPPCGGPPPPPPPAPASAPADDSESRSQLFAQLNQGENITKGLKHVSDKMKTHKNPSLKTHGGPVRSGPKPFTSPKPTSVSAPAAKPVVVKKQPPVLELEGKKWKVENQENVSNLEITDTELKQVVYVYKCVNSTLQVKGKINSIIVDNCKKLGLVFEDAVGIVEIINSKDVKVQVMGKVPTISINKTDGCHVYLSQDSLTCEIISAKSSEMNVLVPTSSGDYNEFPVPEQFKTLWNGQKLVTTVTEIAG